MLKRPGSPRKRDNTVDFLKIKTYNNQDRIDTYTKKHIIF